MLFVDHPRELDWCVTTIRPGEEGFETRADLPAHWGGLTDEDFEGASGVLSAGFCHKGLFVATAKSRDAALAIAEMAASNAPCHTAPERPMRCETAQASARFVIWQREQ